MKIIQGLKHGLYEIYWKSGGSSLAAVGFDREGNNWHAPVNWTSGITIDWSGIKAYKPLILNEYQNKTKAIRSDYLKVSL